MGKPFVRFCEGWRHNQCMAEILWHRRETRRQTENTNIMPIARQASFYSTIIMRPRVRSISGAPQVVHSTESCRHSRLPGWIAETAGRYPYPDDCAPDDSG